jgi:hypothetical protein
MASALCASCAAAPVAANEIDRGSRIQQLVTGRLDAIHAGYRVEDDRVYHRQQANKLAGNVLRYLPKNPAAGTALVSTCSTAAD